GAPTPKPPPSGTVKTAPSRATYPAELERRNPAPSHGQNGGRYPPAAADGGAHENPRWERPAAPQQGQRVADRGPPQRIYSEEYPNQRQQQSQQHQRRPPPQQQQQQSWHNGRPAPQSGVNPAGDSRYRGEGEPAHYPEQHQWHEHGHGEDDEAVAHWEPAGRNHYPPAHRPPVRREPPGGYHAPAGSRSSGWYDEAGSRDAPPAHADYGENAQLRARPPGRAMMPRGVSGSSLGVPPRSDDGYGDDDMPAGERPRPRAPRDMAAPGRAASWTNDAEYTVPPPISIKGEDFEKEVVKAAALLVAEREMRAREEARKQGKAEQKTPDDQAAPGREDKKKSKKADGKARGGGRPAGEDSEKRKKRESSSHKDDKGDDARPKSKRTRRSRSEEGRGGPGGRHSNEPRRKAKTRDQSRGRQEEVEDGDRYREDGSRRTHKEKDQDNRESSRPRPGSGGTGSPRENPWGSSTADSGYYVHVGGLSFSTTLTTLAKRFAAFGDVNGFKIIFNKVSCRVAETSDRRGSKEEAAKAAVVTASSGFAFISFDNERGMEKAVEGMDGQVMDGHILKVS
ncbi:unnamed protein product, partial [Hapterophycus canaliculatus]